MGQSQDEAQEEAERLAAEEGLVMILPFDDPEIIAGQGTVGLEVVEAMPNVARLLCRSPVEGWRLVSRPR